MNMQSTLDATVTLTAPSVECSAVDCGGLPVSAHVSQFTGTGGVAEYHITVTPERRGGIETQLDLVRRGYALALESVGLDMDTAIVRRFFCSDLPNQFHALEARAFSNPRSEQSPCAVSWVRQPPAPPAKVALWACHVSDPRGSLTKRREGGSLTLDRGELRHHWTAGLAHPGATSSHEQTQAVLGEYEGFLRERGLTLTDHVVRTWFFVQNIDANYAGLVAARRDLFTARGLTPDTHYIASTGIEGGHFDVATKVMMDAYAISGLRPAQVEHLSALDHMSPTHVYGVTFERAVALSYRDRRHVLISGTASIDREGRILHPGNVARQLDRALENVEALLKPVGGGLSDMCHWLVYVRDSGDYALARDQMRERFGDVPFVVVHAPVCRPGWLIEVEGQAILRANHRELPAY